MILNPIYILLFIYITSNLLVVFQGVAQGGVKLDGEFYFLSDDSLIFSFIVQLFFLLIIVINYRFFKFKFKFKRNGMVLKDSWGWFVVFWQLAFLIFSMKMGINIAGVGGEVQGNSILNIFFVLLQPDVLFFIISLHLKSRKLLALSVVVFLISMFMRGWMGGVFIVVFILLIRSYPLKLSIKNTIFLAVMFFMVIVLLPVLTDLKWAVRGGVSIFTFLSRVDDSFTLLKYENAIFYLLNRFQHVGHVALLIENKDEVFLSFQRGVFSGYWMDGLPQNILAKLFSFEIYKLNTYIVEYIYRVVDPEWNTNPGLAGWFLILGVDRIYLLLYLVVIITFPFYIVSKYAGQKMLLLLTFFSITYLFHGWIGAYIDIVIYALFLVIVNKVYLLGIRSTND